MSTGVTSVLPSTTSVRTTPFQVCVTVEHDSSARKSTNTRTLGDRLRSGAASAWMGGPGAA